MTTTAGPEAPNSWCNPKIRKAQVARSRVSSSTCSCCHNQPSSQPPKNFIVSLLFNLLKKIKSPFFICMWTVISLLHSFPTPICDTALMFECIFPMHSKPSFSNVFWFAPLSKELCQKIRRYCWLRPVASLQGSGRSLSMLYLEMLEIQPGTFCIQRRRYSPEL